MLHDLLKNSRRAFLFGCVSMAMMASGTPVEAQKISVEATKLKLKLVNEVFVLNEVIVAEAGMIKLGLRVEDAKAALARSTVDMEKHLVVLRNGDEAHGMTKEHSVAIQVILDRMDEDWHEYAADVQQIAEHAKISDEEFWKLHEDNAHFGADAKELVKTMYDVYAETVFSPEEGRALYYLAQERTHCEELREEFILTAIAADPAEHHKKMEEVLGVFSQTLSVLAHNHAMFGIAPPPNDQAVQALATVEHHWEETVGHVEEIVAKERPEASDVEEMWDLCDTLGKEIDAAIAVYSAAMPVGG